ncbi:hypothetical protein HDV02_005836 [Globomyces sp. JEL0801]|nr:hypothetical protein HDV02_005836 [Globomyces sp. JEL0801]
MEKLPTNSTYFSLPLKTNADIKAIKMPSDPYQRHKYLLKHYPGPTLTKSDTISEIDILKKNHQFLRDSNDVSWEARVAQKYYDKLFKEYCLGDFSRYKTGAIGLRWRTKQECISGKGEDLHSWEVNFVYLEERTKKNALVKIRLCPKCSVQLNYKKMKEEKVRAKMEKKLKRKESQKDCESDMSNLKRQKVNETSDKEAELDVEEIIENPVEHQNIWSKPIVLSTEELGAKSKEEEMDEFLSDLLL